MAIRIGDGIALTSPLVGSGNGLNDTIIGGGLLTKVGVRSNSGSDPQMSNGESVRIDTDGDGSYNDEANTTKSDNDRYLDTEVTFANGNTVTVTAELVTLSNGSQVLLFISSSTNAINNQNSDIVSIKLGTFSNQFADTYNQENFTNPINIGVSCFTTGTMITGRDGAIPVEKLAAGDMVMTKDHGSKAVAWIGSKVLNAADLRDNPSLCPIKIHAGALGVGIPMTDLIVSPQHRILIRSRIVGKMFDSTEVLVAAVKLLNLPGVERMNDVESVEYFHFLFDKHEIVFANGAEVESLYLGQQMIQSLSDKSAAEIILLFPELAYKNKHTLARECVTKGSHVRKVICRAQKNNRPLVEVAATP